MNMKGYKKMWEEEKWYKKCFKWIEIQIDNLVDEYGLKKCLIMCGVIGIALSAIIFLLIFCWNLETDVTITPVISTQEVLQEDKEVMVTRTAKMNEGISIDSFLIEAISSMNSDIEAIALFNDLAKACDNVGQKEEVINLPKGAGEIIFEDIGVYGWTRKGKHFLSDKEFLEIHVVLFMSGEYVEAYIYSSERLKLDVGVTMGTYQERLYN